MDLREQGDHKVIGIDFLRVKFGKVILIGTCLLASSSVCAVPTSEKEITGLNSGTVQFLFAHEAVQGNSPLEPGIYGLSPKSDIPEKILPGSILGINRSYNGVLAQLGIGALTNRYETATVLDGRVTLFTTQTKATDPLSYVSFGSKEWPVVDLLSRRQVEIPLVKNLDDIAFVRKPGTANRVGEIIIFSIKSPHPLGSGFTVAAMVKFPDSKAGRAMQMVSPPVVIDYEHYESRSLYRFLDLSSTSANYRSSILAPLELNRLGQGMAGEAQFLVEWQESILRVLRSLKSGAEIDWSDQGKIDVLMGGEGKAATLPYYNFAAQRTELGRLPSTSIFKSATGLVAHQDFDPQGGISSIRVMGKSNHSKVDTLTIPGVIDRMPKTRKPRVYEIPGDTQSALFVVAGGARLVLTPTLAASAPVLIPGNEIIDTDFTNFSAVIRTTPTKTREKSRHYVFMSLTGATPKTFVLAFDEISGVFRFDKKLKINSKYYPQKELEARIHLADGEGPDGKSILFDSVSSSERIARRTSKLELKTPLINVTESNGYMIVQTYLNTLEKLDLITELVEYRRYESAGAKETQTGFYVHDAQARHRGTAGDTIKYYPGYLYKKKVGEGIPYSIDRTNMKIPISSEHESDAAISAYAFSPTEVDKKPNSFSIFIHVASLTDGKIKSGVLIAEAPFEISRLNGGNLVQGRRKRKNNVTLFLIAKPTKGDQSKRQERGGIFTVNFDIKDLTPNGNQGSRLSPPVSQWLERGEILPAELPKRVFWDGPGEMYWVETPHLAPTATLYGVRRIASESEKVLRTNRAGERIHLRFNEPMDSERVGGLFTDYSKWMVHSESELTTRFKSLATHLAEMRKLTEKGSEQKAKRENRGLFPALNAYLDELAQPHVAPQHQVLLVEPDLRDQLQKSILARLVSGKSNLFSFRNHDFNFYPFDLTASYLEIREELDLISKKSKRNTGSMLFVDLKELLDLENVALSGAKSVAGAQDDEDEDEDEDEKDRAQKSSDPLASWPFSVSRREGSKTNHASKPGTKDEKSSDAEKAEAAQAARDLGSSGTDSGVEPGEEVDNSSNEFPGSRMMVIAAEGARPTKNFFRTPHAKHISTLVLATPKEWRALHAAYPAEAEMGAFRGYNLNYQYLTASWTLWAPNSTRASKKVIDASKSPIGRDEFSVFPGLEKILVEAAAPQGTAKHKILVVPEELKPLVERLILSRWATENKELKSAWHFSNPKLTVSQINTDKGTTQEEVIENLETLKGALPHRQGVLLGDLAEIVKIGRPGISEGGRGYFVRDPAVAKEQSTGLELPEETGDEPSANLVHRQLPHLIWLLSTEGDRIQPKKNREWTLKHDVTNQIPMLLIASEKDMIQLNAATAFEQRFLKLEDQFEIESVTAPSPQVKYALIDQLFSRPEIASLLYNFQHESLSPQEARKTLIEIMVARVDSIARQQGLERTAAFLRAYSRLRLTLTEDTQLRQDRLINRSFFERLYRRVFSMPLSLDILPTNDPLRNLADPEMAAIRLQEMGYEGSPDVKRRVIETVNSQTQGADEGRPVPSTVILYGETSTGKTFLFKKVIEMLNLKVYDYDKPNDDSVGAFIFKPKELLDEKDPANPHKMSVQEAIDHWLHFLTLPQGWRSFTLIDDLDKGSPAVRKALVTAMATVLDDRSKYVRAKRLKTGEIVEVPVRNLNLWLTMNPQPNRKVLEEYVAIDQWWNVDKVDKDLDKYIVAALSGEGFQVDDSFPARWQTKINMDRFPREAKLPTLAGRVRTATAEEFNSNPRFLLFPPTVLGELSKIFVNANAREFLTAATYALMSVDAEMPEAPIYLVLKKEHNESLAGGDQVVDYGVGHDERGRRIVGAQVDSQAIKSELRKFSAVLAVDKKETGSMIRLMNYLVNGFRNHLSHSMILAIQRSKEFRGSTDVKMRQMPALVLGILHTITDRGTLPPHLVKVHPEELGARTDKQIIDFSEEMNRSQKRSPAFFPIPIEGSNSNLPTRDQFLGGGKLEVFARTRKDVIIEYSEKVSPVLQALMSEYFGLENVRAIETPANWAMRLAELEPQSTSKEDGKYKDYRRKNAFKAAGDALVKIYGEFSAALFSADLTEMNASKDYAPILDYDRARLFLVAIDRALTKMPWGQMTNFFYDVAQAAVSDGSFGLRAEVQNFLFSSVYTPLVNLPPESIIELSVSQREVRDFTKTMDPYLKDRFSSMCVKMLSIPEEKR